MKKAYETPKVAKMVFNYSDVVVASNTVQCTDEITYTNVHHDGAPVCNTDPKDDPTYGMIGT